MKKLLATLLFLGHLLPAFAQLPVVSSGKIVRIDSFPSQFVEGRNIDVWLPEGYPSKGRYAVLYMHDGQMLFDSTKTWNRQEWLVDEVAARLQATGQTIPFIIVAVPNKGTKRRSEYFPEKPGRSLPHPVIDSLLAEMENPFLADRYLSFLTKEVKPLIDRRFQTYGDAKHTFLAGSSMGGLISMYALCEYPQVFGGAACLSTHWPGSLKQTSGPTYGAIPAAFLSYMEKHLPRAGAHLLYMDHGNRTLDSLYPPLQAKADALLAKKGYRSPFYVSYFFRGTDHSEKAWSARLEVPLLFLLRKDRF